MNFKVINSFFKVLIHVLGIHKKKGLIWEYTQPIIYALYKVQTPQNTIISTKNITISQKCQYPIVLTCAENCAAAFTYDGY